MLVNCRVNSLLHVPLFTFQTSRQSSLKKMLKRKDSKETPSEEGAEAEVQGM